MMDAVGPIVADGGRFARLVGCQYQPVFGFAVISNDNDEGLAASRRLCEFNVEPAVGTLVWRGLIVHGDGINRQLAKIKIDLRRCLSRPEW